MENNNNMNERTVNIDLDNLKGKEPTDIEAFNFEDAIIEKVEVKDYSTPNQERLRLLIQTNILKEGTKIRGTTFINLFKDNEGNICYSKSSQSNATKILKYFGVDKFKDLLNKKCKTIVKLNNNGSKRLEIYYGE